MKKKDAIPNFDLIGLTLRQGKQQQEYGLSSSGL